MRMRTATTTAILGAALLLGATETSAQATQAVERAQVTRTVEASTSTDASAVPASWRTIEEHFFYYQCENAKLYYEYHFNWTMRCYGGGPVSYWKLQRYY